MAEEYPKSIVEAIDGIRQEVGTVEKDGENTFHNYNYVSERAMQAAVRPLMQKHGLLILPSCVPEQGVTTDERGLTHYIAEYTLVHANGDVWPDKLYVAAVGYDKGGDKGVWKANTGAFKYLLSRLFMLDTGDDPEKDRVSDKSGPAHRPQPETRRAPPSGNAPPDAPSGRKLHKKHPLLTKQFWGAAFGAAEKAHGKDDAMKWLAIDKSVKLMGFSRLDDVPEERFDELMHNIKTYPDWWNGANEAPPEQDGEVNF